MIIPIDFHLLRRHLMVDRQMAEAFEKKTKRLPLKDKIIIKEKEIP